MEGRVVAVMVAERELGVAGSGTDPWGVWGLELG